MYLQCPYRAALRIFANQSAQFHVYLPCLNTFLAWCLNRFLIVKALVGSRCFQQEEEVGAFSGPCENSAKDRWEDHWPGWRWAHTWSPWSRHMSGGPVRAGPHTPAPHTAACWPAVDGSPPCRQHHTPRQIFLPRVKQIFLQWQFCVINVRDVIGQRGLSNWRNEAEENNISCQMNSCEYFLWTQRWRWRLSGVENLPKWFLF